MSAVRFPVPKAAVLAPEVYVQEIPTWFETSRRIRRTVPWRPDLTIRELLPEGWEPGETAVLFNARATDDLDQLVPKHSGLVFVLVPGAPGGVFVAKLLFSLFISYIIGRLLAPDLDARQVADESSPNYGWRGIQTNYQILGLPYPLALGAGWTGGAVLQQFVEVEADENPTSYLYLLICVSTGPIHSIAGFQTDRDSLTGDQLGRQVYINDNPAATVSGITAWIRLGSKAQDVIGAFNRIRGVQEVDLPIEQTLSGEGSPVVDWSLAVSVDLAEAESCVLTVEFPRGLYNLVDGEYGSRTVELAVRYARRSGSSTVSSWTTVYFGALSQKNITASSPKGFPVDIPFDFFDPDSVTPPVFGDAQEWNKNARDIDRARTPLNLRGFLDWAVVGSALGDFTISMRFKALNNGSEETAWGWGTYTGSISSGSPTTVTGVILWIKEHPLNSNWSICEVFWGDGSSWDSLEIDHQNVVGNEWGSFNNNGWHDIVVRGAVDTGGYRMTLFFDGELNDSKVSSTTPVVGVRFSVGCYDPGYLAGSDFAELIYDEIAVWGRALSTAEIFQRWNGGTWLFIETPSSEEDLVALWLFDGVVLARLNDYTGNNNRLELFSSSDWPPEVTGNTSNGASGTTTRDTYRVEIQRLDLVGNSDNVSDEVRLLRATAILQDEIAYNGLALLGLKIKATDQLSGNRPNILISHRGRSDCPVWNGDSTESPSFDRTYSEFAADQLALIVTDRESGGGAFFRARDVDWPAFDAWRNFQMRKVYNRGTKHTATQLAKAPATDYGFTTTEYPDGFLVVTIGGSGGRLTDLGRSIYIRLLDVGDGDYPSGDLEESIKVAWWDSDSHTVAVPWPAGLADPGTNPFINSAAATVVVITEQLKCGLIFAERNVRFMGAVETLCAAGRATPILLGDKLSVVYQDAGTPVALFNGDNIMAGTFRAGASRKEEQYNSATVEIANENLRGERTTVQRRHPSLMDASSTAARRHTVFEMRGCQRVFQAVREVEYRLNQSQAENLRVEFETFMEAMFLRPGDRAVVQYPVPSWHYGGKVAADQLASGSFRIDSPVVLEASTTYYAAFRRSETDVVEFIQVLSPAGSYGVNDVVRFTGNLAGGPLQEGDLWVIGTATFGARVFKLVSTRLAQNQMAHTSWIQADEDVFPDDDSDDTVLELELGDGTGQGNFEGYLQSSLMGSGGNFVSEATERLEVVEEAWRETRTGALRHGIRVSWELTEGVRIDRTRVWVERPAGRRTLEAEVSGGVRTTSIYPGDFARGDVLRVIVQHVAKDGTAPDPSRCSSRRITALGLFPPPPAPVSLAVDAPGDGAFYTVELPEGWDGAVLELRMGGTFVGIDVARLPQGQGGYGPTPVWYGGTVAAPMMARLALANGVRGEFVGVSTALAPPGYTLVVEDEFGDDWEDEGGATNAPVLTELEVDGLSGELKFDPLSSELVGVYESWELDAGAAARYHVSAVVDGDQWFGGSPLVIEGGFLGGRYRAWTGEGPLDSHDPAHDELGVVLEWKRTDAGADPSGASWERFRTGPAYFRSAMLRLTITRPDATWDVRVSRLGLAIRSIP